MNCRSIFAFSLVASCAAVGTSDGRLTGEWGGQHVGLSLTSASGTLEYDCAAGTITGPLVIKPDGTFIAEGTHTPAHGGPDIEGQVLPSYRAHYNGRIHGNTMVLEGRTEKGVLGPFTLRRNAAPVIFRCL